MAAVGEAGLKSCLAPVVDERSRLLLLGSLPGEVSLRSARYYAHPQNQFWRLLEAVIDEPLVALDYEQRLARLLDRGIGLWDVVASARRPGSLDSALRDVGLNPLARLVESLPALHAIGFNGSTAAKLGRRALSGSGLGLVDLPSSSAALTTGFTSKREAWSALREYLD